MGSSGELGGERKTERAVGGGSHHYWLSLSDVGGGWLQKQHGLLWNYIAQFSCVGPGYAEG